MNLCGRGALAPVIFCAAVFAGSLVMTVSALAAPDGAGQMGPDRSRPQPVCEPSVLDSPYIPVDSWVYPAVLRLYGMGFVDDVFLGMRPYTRATLGDMADQA